jgi:hypothetical protein
MQSLLLARSLHNDSVTNISLQKSFSTMAFMSSIPMTTTVYIESVTMIGLAFGSLGMPLPESSGLFGFDRVCSGMIGFDRVCSGVFGFARECSDLFGFGRACSGIFMSHPEVVLRVIYDLRNGLGSKKRNLTSRNRNNHITTFLTRTLKFQIPKFCGVSLAYFTLSL